MTAPTLPRRPALTRLTQAVTGSGELDVRASGGLDAEIGLDTIDDVAPDDADASPAERIGPTTARLNWLRAAVLGANDGIVSVGAVVVGVAGATEARHTLIMTGLAALVGGAVSMALGEYVSVASARDSQRAHTATLDDDEVANPWHAALASAMAFIAGAVLPFLAVLLIPAPFLVPGTIGAVLVALALTGWGGARLGRAPALRPVLRVLVGGGLALGLTFAVGSLFGVAVG